MSLPNDAGGPPPGFEPSGMSFEEAMASALGDMPRAAEPAPAAVPVAAPPPVATPAPAPVVEAPKPAEPQPAGLAELMRREARVLEQERAMKEQLADVQRRLDEYETAKHRFRVNPVEYVRSLAPDLPPQRVAELLWFEELGDAAPVEHRLGKEVRSTRTELEKLRDDVQTERQRLAEEKARMERETATRQFVGTVPDENRLLKSLAKVNPNMATGMILDACRMAQEQTGEAVTPQQAAALVEQYLSQFESVFAPPAAAAPPAPKESPAPTSLRNEHSKLQPSRTPESESDPNVLRRNALIAAGYDPADPALRALFDAYHCNSVAHSEYLSGCCQYYDRHGTGFFLQEPVPAARC